MTDSLFALADRANLAYSHRPGFIRCTVESEQPPVLAFDFASPEMAQEFMFETELQDARLRMEIPHDRPDTVLQYR